jgi:hypothetical protein
VSWAINVPPEGRHVLEHLPAEHQVELIVAVQRNRDVADDALVVGVRARGLDLVGFDVQPDVAASRGAIGGGDGRVATGADIEDCDVGDQERAGAREEFVLHLACVSVRQSPGFDQRQFLGRCADLDRRTHRRNFAHGLACERQCGS